MADQDVSDVLTDPDFTSSFDLVRYTEVAVGKGRSVDSEGHFPGLIGVVLSATARDVIRVPDLTRTAGSIVIYITGFVIEEQDVVTWNGADYVVLQVDDMTNFGAGFVRASCKKQSIP